jgi:hypothetical protein
VAQQRPAMTMGAYLAEVRHAVEGLLPLIWQEQDTLSGRKEQLAERKAELARLERQVKKEYENAAWLLNNQEWDDEGIGTLRYWDNYFGPDKERYHLGQQIPGMQEAVESAEASVEAHRFSIDVLASTVIQIAKQGMSVVHSRKPAGTGRPIGSSQHLSEVVSEARNQGAHWEERTPFRLWSPVSRPLLARWIRSLVTFASATWPSTSSRCSDGGHSRTLSATCSAWEKVGALATASHEGLDLGAETVSGGAASGRTAAGRCPHRPRLASAAVLLQGVPHEVHNAHRGPVGRSGVRCRAARP